MEDDNNDLSSIESRHRKDRKELQAKIQALKKAAKNDKTKKKELTSEISRLEIEMEMKHKQEIDEFMVDQDKEGDTDNTVVEQSVEPELKPKLSKAQKRRDKKSQQDKDREEQIKQQEKENIHGPRNIETQAITTKLKQKNLKIFPIPSDGDCLYKAVTHQLSTIRKQEMTVSNLRSQVAQYILVNKNDFFPFMSNPETCDMLTDAEFESYCDKIKSTNVWGGQLEIRAMSSLLKCPINVIQSTGPETIEQGTEFDGPPLIITYHRHMYKLGEHYNSTIMCIENDDEDE